MIDGQMQVYNLFVHRFCLKPLAVQKANGKNNSNKKLANNREILTDQATKVEQLIQEW